MPGVPSSDRNPQYERRAARDQGYANQIAKMLMGSSMHEQHEAEEATD
jgi:hypothetical protein